MEPDGAKLSKARTFVMPTPTNFLTLAHSDMGNYLKIGRASTCDQSELRTRSTRKTCMTLYAPTRAKFADLACASADELPYARGLYAVSA